MPLVSTATEVNFNL